MTRNGIDPDTISDDALMALVDTHPNADAAMRRFNRAYQEAERKPDQYDAAIAYLTQHPEQIRNAWENPYIHRAGCLFRYVAVDLRTACGKLCGCLTQIRASHGLRAETPELTAMIRRDSRIPVQGSDITLAHLPVFAEWQRLIDYELKREPVSVVALRAAEDTAGDAMGGDRFE